MEQFTLREVCEMVGVSRRAIQGWENLGIVVVTDRNKYGHLLYDEEALDTIRRIKLYRDMGFAVKEVKELIEASEEIRKFRISEMLVVMREELEQLKRNIRIAEEMLH